MKKILIVEDETLIALDLKNRLERHGYQVLPVTATAADAVESAFKNRPELILMDVVLKGKKSGFEAACSIIESYPVPVIFLTGNIHLLDDERVTKIPVYRILGKPPFERVLMDMIGKLLEND